jgi:hypothetical protein
LFFWLSLQRTNHYGAYIKPEYSDSGAHHTNNYFTFLSLALHRLYHHASAVINAPVTSPLDYWEYSKCPFQPIALIKLNFKVAARTNQQPHNKALHPTAYSSVRRSSSLRFRRRVSCALCHRACFDAAETNGL